MDIKPGQAFADVGASTGYYTIMMSSLLEGTTIYVQDIDSMCLNRREFDKVVDYYSLQSKMDLRKRNELKFTLGNSRHTNLPPAYFDHIYSNGTFHHFADPDAVLQDLYTRLKPGGDITVRDSFATADEQYCGDRNSTKLVKTEHFLQIMERNGFILIGKKDFTPYPAYRFRSK
jgi:ubiquinone/menaquinone biosynthesis C-methylase UbiE